MILLINLISAEVFTLNSIQIRPKIQKHVQEFPIDSLQLVAKFPLLGPEVKIKPLFK